MLKKNKILEPEIIIIFIYNNSKSIGYYSLVAGKSKITNYIKE